jgi:multiple sugar transport system permease protein
MARSQASADSALAAARPRTLSRRRKARLRRLGEHASGWAFVAPAAFLIGLFGFVCMGWAFILSFQNNDLVTPGTFVGLDNYRQLLHDPTMSTAARNTIEYTLAFVPLSVGGGLLVALVLNRQIRFVRLYRTAVFVPVVTSTVATAILFSWIFDPDYGLVNAVLSHFGIARQGFLESPGQALWVIVAMTVWGWIGFNVLIYLAALQDVPRELVEAAAIDGAGRFQTFLRVTLPVLRPATLFLVVWSTINALQLFDEIYVTTKGGPLDATRVVVYYLYQETFESFHAGYGAAIAYSLLVVILAVTGLQFLLVGREGRRGTGA